MPFQGPIKLIHSFNGSWLRIITTLLGLSAGVSVAYIAIKESLIATITDEKVQLDKDGHSKTIPRKDIDIIFLDGKQLVI
ncbi:YqeB family protein [Bacillus sp. FSL K6-3431]|uniref:YqeB family protein n=1 Tax=Bacillus sp. FSL K6-3431 TaxID=2921500 RepID=UPI004046E5E0